MNIKVNFDHVINRMKAMHGVGQPPLLGVSDAMFHYLSEAGIPYSRLHDVSGTYGGNLFVDIPNLFRDFDADEENENSYDFAFTDKLIASLYQYGCEPVFRLGVSIENHHKIKAYRIFPPEDYDKWSRVCEKIIRHYNEGWANGFNYGIRYWEIWNEPDNEIEGNDNPMWRGNAEEFYRLYEVTAKHLKEKFGDTINVGGYGSCGFRYILSNPGKYEIDETVAGERPYSDERSKYFMDFFEGFFKHIRETQSPIDFFSWHSYLSTDRTVQCALYLERRLKELGFAGLETHLNEWNNLGMDGASPELVSELAKKERNKGIAAAKAAAMMCAMQDTGTDMLCYYDARVGVSYYGGMFNPMTRKPLPAYYSFVAFNELFQLGNQVECLADEKNGIYVLAAKDEDKHAVLIANTTTETVFLENNLSDDMQVFFIDSHKCLEKIDMNARELRIIPESVLLVKNYV